MSKNGVFKELKKSLFLKLFPQFIINQDLDLMSGLFSINSMNNFG